MTLSQRSSLPSALLDRLSRDHSRIGEPLSSVATMQQLWSCGTESETVAYFEEVLTGFGGMGVGAGGNRNDRGGAILLATNLENSLQISSVRLKLE
jgi:hypothetical protein